MNKREQGMVCYDKTYTIKLILGWVGGVFGGFSLYRWKTKSMDGRGRKHKAMNDARGNQKRKKQKTKKKRREPLSSIAFTWPRTCCR